MVASKDYFIRSTKIMLIYNGSLSVYRFMYKLTINGVEIETNPGILTLIFVKPT